MGKLSEFKEGELKWLRHFQLLAKVSLAVTQRTSECSASYLAHLNGLPDKTFQHSPDNFFFFILLVLFFLSTLFLMENKFLLLLHKRNNKEPSPGPSCPSTGSRPPPSDHWDQSRCCHGSGLKKKKSTHKMPFICFIKMLSYISIFQDNPYSQATTWLSSRSKLITHIAVQGHLHGRVHVHAHAQCMGHFFF